MGAKSVCASASRSSSFVQHEADPPENRRSGELVRITRPTQKAMRLGDSLCTEKRLSEKDEAMPAP